MPPRTTPSRPTQRRDGRPEAPSQETSTTVAIRLRPLNDREREGKQNRIWRCVPTHNSVTQTSPDGNPLPDGKGTFFTYDRIFDEDSSTDAVYDGVAKEIVHSVSRGMNGTIFAYGQTSSGKTFTMQGGGGEANPGIVQIATQDLFRFIQEKTDRMFLMRVSYLEIYQEEIRDLLKPENTNMQVREDPRKGVYIEAHEETVGDFETVLKVLKMGEKQRHVGCTEMNSRSSRSHTIFRLVLESQEMFDEKVHASQEDVDTSTLVATLNLVDLAGSESVRHTGATGIRQKEGGMINQSLLTLSRVIQTLTQPGNSHVNYRDSKLTRILQPSLSGNARMAIICCATAAEGFLEETRSTLQFASRAKEIKTRAIVNEVVDDKTQIRRMSHELAVLKRKQAEQEKAGGGGPSGELVETLQQEKAQQAEKIDRLKNLLLNIAPAIDEEGEPLPFTLAVSPRFRRGKRARETWCPGGSNSVITAPRPLRLLNSDPNSVEFREDGTGHLPKRRSSDATGRRTPVVSEAAGASAEGVSKGDAAQGGGDGSADGGAKAAPSEVAAIAAKLEEALAAKEETDEEMKEFVAYAEDIERVLASTKAQLVQEVEAAKDAANAVAAASAAARDASLREQEAAAALHERIAALEAEKAELEEQEAVLRAENDEAAAIMAENQARVPEVADADAQTDGLDSTDADAGEDGVGGAAVADLQAEIAERDGCLEGLKGRVKELEGSLTAAREEQEEQDIRHREQKQKADESLIEALAGQRRAEDAFSAACQSELEMRCRLESAEQQAQEAEKAREEMVAKAEAAAASRSKDREEIEVLGDRMAETEARLRAAEDEATSASGLADQAKAAAEEETKAARLKMLAQEAASAAKDKTIAELGELVDGLKAAGDARGEDEAAASSQRQEQLLADKVKAEEEAAAARAENAALLAKIEELEEQLVSGDREAEAAKAREELAAAVENASAAEAKTAEEMARVVAEAEASSEKAAALQSKLDAKTENAAKLEEAVEVLESRLKSAQEAASERETADAARIAEAESQMEEVAGQLLAANEAAAAATAAAVSEKEAVAKKDGLLAELEDKLAAANELVVFVQDASAEKDAAAAARVAELETELASADETLAAAKVAAEEREAAATARIAEVESDLSAAEDALATAQASKSSEEEAVLSSLAARGELETQLSAARESLEVVRAEMEGRLKAAAELAEGVRAEEASRHAEELKAAKASLESKAAEVARLEQRAEAEVLETKEAGAEAAAKIAAEKEAVERELTRALEDSEKLSKEALDLTDQLMEKDAELARAREKAEARVAELADVEAAAATAISAAAAAAPNADGFDGEAPEPSAELRRLRTDLDQKGSELDRAMQENEGTRAELKEMKDMLSAAANAAGAAGADEDSLRKRVSQLVCENGLLKGERDHLEALASQSRSAAKTEASRAAADVESLEREVQRLSQAADKAVKVEGEGNRAKAAFFAMEAQLSGLRQEHGELKEAAKRSLDRCSEAEAEVGKLRGQLAELEGRQSGRDAVVALETKVDELEQEVRRAAASKAEMEADARESSNRAKRLQGQVEMLRSEYEVVSEEACGLRGSLAGAEAKLEEALRAQQEASAVALSNSLSEDRSEELEAEVDELRERLRRREEELVEMLRVEQGKFGELQAAHDSSVAALEGKVSELEASQDSAAALQAQVSEIQSARDAAIAALENKESEMQAAGDAEAKISEMQATHDAAVASLEDKLSEMQAAHDSAAAAAASAVETKVSEMKAAHDTDVGAKVSELRAAHDAAITAHEDRLAEMQTARDTAAASTEAKISEIQAAHDAAVAALESRISEMQAAHDEVVATLEDKAAESLELAEQIQADQDENLAALRTQMDDARAVEVAALEGRLAEAVAALEDERAEAQRLSGEREALSAEVGRAGEAARASAAELEERLEAALEGQRDLEERLAEADAEGKATEEQLRHRLTAQVAEAENLRQELMDTRERSDKAEAAVRAADQRAREGADEKTKGLLAEMENLCQEKLIAENKAGDMEAELDRLREEVATAEQTAAKDQGMLIRAAEERMAVLDKAAEEKDEAIAELRTALDAARAAPSPPPADSAADVEKATAALHAKIFDLKAATGEYEETIKRQDARIKKLEQVRLTNGQVEKLQAMKASARKTAAENAELKQRLSVLQERLDSAGAPSGDASAVVASLQADNDTLMEKLKGYGKRVYDLEKERARVHAAVEELGGSAPVGGDLADAVLDCADRVAGSGGGRRGSSISGGDASVTMSTGAHDEAMAAAAVAEASEELERELREAREALRREEAGRAVLKEQMVAGVAKFRALEAQERASRERVEEVEAELRGAVSAAVKTKEKEHERQLKFLKEENVQLFQEVADWKAKAEQHTAELKVLREKLAAIQTAQQPPASASKKRALGDRTNSTPAEVTHAIAGKPGAALASTPAGVQPAAAAERRAASRALIDGEGPVNDEGAGECNQS